MNIELYYFDGCPSYRQALETLRHALRAEGLPERVDLIAVRDQDDARAKRFLGSPSIRVNGVDVERPFVDGREYVFGCRVYVANGWSRGWPSVDELRQALRRTAAGGGA